VKKLANAASCFDSTGTKGQTQENRGKNWGRFPKRERSPEQNVIALLLFVGNPERKSLWKNSGKIRRKESV
jgi:hypothetical protein